MGAEAGVAAAGLLAFDRFTRSNPRTDRFQVLGFHHVEILCGDASNTWRRFAWGLGMQLVAKSDLSTGNSTFASYVIGSGHVRLAFTAPYGRKNSAVGRDSHDEISSGRTRARPIPGFDPDAATDFFNVHGLGVRAVGVHVADAAAAFDASVENGAPPVLRPASLVDESSGAAAVISEVGLYGDVVLRYVSFEPGMRGGPYLPNYEEVSSPNLEDMSLGIRRLDHAVGNVPNLAEAVAKISRFTGFHEFAEFSADDVGTAESGLNSLVLASNNEMVLLPMNEPVHGTKRRSQIQTYLDHNGGMAGLQHLALLCDDIFVTLKGMRMRSYLGGFEFMPAPNSKYYRDLPARIGDSLTPRQIELCEELGILVDKDDQGVLLQIFTKPVGDRPTLFVEIIQRIGCMEVNNGGVTLPQKGGCGGFGKGNFAALFKSIEDYEKTLE